MASAALAAATRVVDEDAVAVAGQEGCVGERAGAVAAAPWTTITAAPFSDGRPAHGHLAHGALARALGNHGGEPVALGACLDHLLAADREADTTDPSVLHVRSPLEERDRTPSRARAYASAPAAKSETKTPT